MKLSNLKINNLAYIKNIEILDYDLKIHLMELGIVPDTQTKLIRISNDLYTILIRNYELTLTKDIASNIEVYDSFNR